MSLQPAYRHRQWSVLLHFEIGPKGCESNGKKYKGKLSRCESSVCRR
jgi:hypothetical protein